MYGLIHKLKNKKKKKNGKQYSKAITTKTKDKHTRFGFALYSCFSFEKCACCQPSESTAQFWCLVWPFPYLDINNNSRKKGY